jgi:hypothetical protein
MFSLRPAVLRTLLPLALLGLACVALADSAPRPKLVRVTFDATLRPETLQGAGFDLLEMEAGGSALLLEWPGDEARFAAIGARPVIVDPDPTATYQKRAAAELALRPTPRPARVLSAVRPDGAAAESLPPFGPGSWLGFWTPPRSSRSSTRSSPTIRSAWSPTRWTRSAIRTRARRSGAFGSGTRHRAAR